MSNESIEITDADIEGLIDHGQGSEEPSFHPILMVWREVLKPARGEVGTKVTPAFANRIVTAYTGITYADMEAYRDLYFDMLLKLEVLLLEEIDSDDECLSYTTPEEDVENNGQHYKNLLTSWQVALLQWELDWETTNPDAAVELAAISEIHKMFFGPTGVTAFLDNIKFQFDEHDQAALAAVLQELKESK